MITGRRLDPLVKLNAVDDGKHPLLRKRLGNHLAGRGLWPDRRANRNILRHECSPRSMDYEVTVLFVSTNKINHVQNVVQNSPEQ